MKRLLLIQILLAPLTAQVLSDPEPHWAVRAEVCLRSNVGDLGLPSARNHRCTTCEEFKDASAFSASWLRKKSKICRECKAGYNRSWYLRNKSKHMADVRRNNARYKQRNGALLLQLKNHPCVDCGATLHPFAMDFDHVRGIKERDVSDLIKRTTSVKLFLAEVAKCDLVCANCHRIRTARRIEDSGKRVYWAPGQPRSARSG